MGGVPRGGHAQPNLQHCHKHPVGVAVVREVMVGVWVVDTSVAPGVAVLHITQEFFFLLGIGSSLFLLSNLPQQSLSPLRALSCEHNGVSLASVQHRRAMPYAGKTPVAPTEFITE